MGSKFLSKEAGYDVLSVQHCTHYQLFVKIRHDIIQLFHSILFFLSFNFFFQLCVVIRFFHPRHNGQWPRTSKDFYTRSYPLHYLLVLILEKEPVIVSLKRCTTIMTAYFYPNISSVCIYYTHCEYEQCTCLQMKFYCSFCSVMIYIKTVWPHAQYHKRLLNR